MLNFLDALLNGIFSYGIPILVILWTLFGIILAVLCLPAEEFLYIKIEAIGFAILNSCCCWWFFVWKNEMMAKRTPAYIALEQVQMAGIPQFTHNDFLPAMMALIITTIVLGFAYLMKRAFRVPYFVMAIIYLGILFFCV
jgi:hypothetical protein